MQLRNLRLVRYSAQLHVLSPLGEGHQEVDLHAWVGTLSSDEQCLAVLPVPCGSPPHSPPPESIVHTYLHAIRTNPLLGPIVSIRTTITSTLISIISPRIAIIRTLITTSSTQGYHLPPSRTAEHTLLALAQVESHVPTRRVLSAHAVRLRVSG